VPEWLGFFRRRLEPFDNMSMQVLLFYLATWSVVALTPGPAMMCSMAQSTRYGFGSSLAGISGIQLGNFLFFVCIALGLGTLLATAMTAFTILRVVGAIYLFYLGVRIIFSTFRRSHSRAARLAIPMPAHRNLFLQGLLIQLSNPKALLFVSALLPQFINRHRSVPMQLVILVFPTIAVDSVVLSSSAFLAQRGIQSLRTSRWSAWLERIFGAALVFLESDCCSLANDAAQLSHRRLLRRGAAALPTWFLAWTAPRPLSRRTVAAE
jgi:homoserine/homoserine lactone efflux protein